MNQMNNYTALLVIVLSFLSIAWHPASSVSSSGSKSISAEFKNYWYDGKAELNRYEIKQARYGEIYEGEAVLIFVTEPFLTESQVKKDIAGSKEKSTSVLKLNFARNFYTGIYPYTLMTSVFDPVSSEWAHPLKLTNIVTEWCGNSFQQLNNRKDHFEIQSYSYFQAEGDTKSTVEKTFLEDGLWTKIRISPDQLPEGKIKVIPGAQFSRFVHIELKPQNANALLYDNKDGTSTYELQYEDIMRTLKVYYNNNFPHDITGWKEIVKSGFGKGKLLTTEAVRKNLTKSAYWSKNSPADSVARKDFGLRRGLN